MANIPGTFDDYTILKALAPAEGSVDEDNFFWMYLVDV
jgi:hypothetical protein